MNEEMLKFEFESIAKDILGIETLEERKSDELDFHTLSVWQIQEALKHAYIVGKSSNE